MSVWILAAAGSGALAADLKPKAPVGPPAPGTGTLESVDVVGQRRGLLQLDPAARGGDAWNLRVDCNQNGIDDACDIDCGTPGGPCDVPGCGQSEDCNGNGQPDECELFGFENIYVWDDGQTEFSLRGCGNHLAWLNHFTVTGGAGLIDAVDIMIANASPGVPFRVYLWSDPDGDGNPTDARVLAFADAQTISPPDTLFRVDLPDTYVGGDGTSFFVGAIMTYPNGSIFPAPLDSSGPSYLGQSWLSGSETPIDPNDLSAGSCEFALLENAIPFPANWPIRAVGLAPVGDCNLNGIPDDCDIAEGRSTDIDGNGRPDECEDCNGNGVPDGWDIDPADPDGNGQTSADCNEDGVPDECQLVGNDCNSDGVPDECQLLGSDCNANDVPDECDLAGGASQDVNGNGVPDECEDCNRNGVPDGWDVDPNDPDGNGHVSADCQSDGAPDECQWGAPAYGTYALDDGSLEATLGAGNPADVAWLNHFVVEPGMEEIAYVGIVHANDVGEGLPVTVYLWSDPDGDGNPADAEVLAAVETTVANPGVAVFNEVFIGDTYVGPAGTSFFVGAIFRDVLGFSHPITRDTNNPRGESWLAIQSHPGSVIPDDLGESAIFGRLDDFGFSGNCLIRARAFDGRYPNDCNDNGVPDDCDIADGTLTDVDGNGVPDECEDCNGNGIPDGCDLTCDGPCAAIAGCGLSTDCDGNGVPDECDIGQGADCNGNGVPDLCDVPPHGTFSLDCNGDLIPDECQLVENDCNTDGIPDDCQLGGPQVPAYTWDDGSSENRIGLANGGRVAWLNRFVTETNGESIKGVRLAYAGVANGTPVTVYLWSDPDGDGSPVDAQVIVSAATTVVNADSDILNAVALPETYVGPPGTSFFVGARIQHAAGELPAPIDLTTNAGRSWLAAGQTVNPNDLSAASLFGPPGAFGFPGNWIVRAIAAGVAPPNDCNANGVPDECDIASGTSGDCNGNGIPDECDVPPLGSASLDCNANRIPDECEVASGEDCDSNGIPDDCQPEDDCDDNGILDSCELDFPEGLVGQYWRTTGGGNFTQRLAARIDANVDFDWGGGPPHPDAPADNFGVRWTGLLRTPDVSGNYTFYLEADDGVRLWINGALLIDEWHGSSGNEYAASVALLGNALNHVRLDYYEDGGGARVALRWAPPVTAKQTIPAAALVPIQDCNGNLLPDACDIAGGASLDLNGNGVPDECEDCNGNGVLDDQDVAGGASDDCNANGLPDECELVAGGDCDGNGVLDACELELRDCDGNGLHDGCQAIGMGLAAQYFDNHGFAGTAVARFDSQIDFDWGDSSPAPGVPANDFGVRWTGALLTEAGGTYQLRVEADDRFALYLDGQRVLTQNSSTSISLPAGAAIPLRAEFEEDAGGAHVRLYWTPPGGSEENIPVSNLLPLVDENMNGLPDVCDFGDCNGNFVSDAADIAAGRSADCDANGVPDECQGADDCDGNFVPDPCEDPDAHGLAGQYWRSLYGNGTFSELLLTRVDGMIDFSSGTWGPDVPSSDFAVRWTGTITTPAASGTYTFFTLTDDGVRLWVNGVLVIDRWFSQPAIERSGTVALEGNRRYLIRVEYFQGSGNATARLSWRPPGGMKTVIPASALLAMADADGTGIPDVCDADCDGNGIADVIDIANCVDDPACADCNGNGVPDGCDISPVVDTAAGYWRFEEGAGPALDASGNGHTGTVTNAVRSTEVPVDPVPLTGEMNVHSLDFAGASARVTIPDSSGLLSMGAAGLTIEAWVKLDQLSDTSGSNQRQWLCQKKPNASTDPFLDYAVLVQRGDNGSASLNFGKTGGFSGRELQVVLGTGAISWSVTSHLELDHLDWAYLRIAIDLPHSEVTFTLDDRSETVLFPPQIGAPNSGPLVLGAYQSSSGTYQQFLRGKVDEVRVSQGIVPDHFLLRSAYMPNSSDDDMDGVPDECDCPGDLDGDLDIDLEDLTVLLSNFGTPSGATREDGDVDGDGDVDLSDLTVLLAAYGTMCG